MKTVTVYLGLGSNIEPEKNLRNAVHALKELFTNVSLSPVYESEAVGFKGDNFLNFVVSIKTQLSLQSLIETIKRTEDQLGRKRGGEKFSSRIIDIDILTYADKTCNQPIVLPREEILENAYVLRPFAELAPDFMLPGTDTKLAALWQAFDHDKQSIKVVDVTF